MRPSNMRPTGFMRHLRGKHNAEYTKWSATQALSLGKPKRQKRQKKKKKGTKRNWYATHDESTLLRQALEGNKKMYAILGNALTNDLAKYLDEHGLSYRLLKPNTDFLPHIWAYWYDWRVGSFSSTFRFRCLSILLPSRASRSLHFFCLSGSSNSESPSLLPRLSNSPQIRRSCILPKDSKAVTTTISVTSTGTQYTLQSLFYFSHNVSCPLYLSFID